MGGATQTTFKVQTFSNQLSGGDEPRVALSFARIQLHTPYLWKKCENEKRMNNLSDSEIKFQCVV